MSQVPGRVHERSHRPSVRGVIVRKRHGNAALARTVRRVLLRAAGDRRIDVRSKLARNDAFVTRWI